MKRALFIGLASLAGAAVTVFFWPPWYEMAPVIPLSQRLARAAMAVAPGIVVTAVGLELLAGVPLASAFLTWFDGLVSGHAKSPAAVWREVRASRRRPLGRLPLPGAAEPQGFAPAGAQSVGAETSGPHGARPYADAHCDNPPGEEGPLDYRPRPVNTDALAERLRDLEAERRILESDLARRIGRPQHPKVARRRDGIRLGDEGSDEFLRAVARPGLLVEVELVGGPLDGRIARFPNPSYELRVPVAVAPLGQQGVAPEAADTRPACVHRYTLVGQGSQAGVLRYTYAGVLA